jgi:hypothetical protein
LRKTLFFGALCLTFAAPAGAEVGVSIRIGEPGFYGAIDIGDFPSPRLIYGQARIIAPGPHHGRPLYLHVPPGHAKHWDKHCHQYNACAHPVYFVEERWYYDTYVPRYRARQAQEGHPNDGWDHGDGQGGGHGKGERSGGGHGQHQGKGGGKGSKD